MPSKQDERTTYNKGKRVVANFKRREQSYVLYQFRICNTTKSIMPIQHSSYFDNGVQSLASERHGRKFSVGIISKGTYHFGTEAAERMTVISGLLKVKVDGTNDWVSFPAGTNFEVASKSGFDVTADVDSAYQCEYL